MKNNLYWCKCGHPESEHGSDFCMGDMTLCDCEEFTSKNPTAAAAVEPEEDLVDV